MAIATDEPDYYGALEVSETASQEEIEAAWKYLSGIFHPDKEHRATYKEKVERRFQELEAAHNTLKDPKRRGEYDSRRRAAASPSGSSPARSGDKESPQPVLDPDAVDFGRLVAGDAKGPHVVSVINEGGPATTVKVPRESGDFWRIVGGRSFDRANGEIAQLEIGADTDGLDSGVYSDSIAVLLDDTLAELRLTAEVTAPARTAASTHSDPTATASAGPLPPSGPPPRVPLTTRPPTSSPDVSGLTVLVAVLAVGLLLALAAKVSQGNDSTSSTTLAPRVDPSVLVAPSTFPSTTTTSPTTTTTTVPPTTAPPRPAGRPPGLPAPIATARFHNSLVAGDVDHPEAYYVEIYGVSVNCCGRSSTSSGRSGSIAARFGAFGLADLAHPNKSCVSTSNGTVSLKPSGLKLEMAEPGRFVGTIIFPIIEPGIYRLTYGCHLGFEKILLTEVP